MTSQKNVFYIHLLCCGLLVCALVPACKSRREPEKTPAEAASALMQGDDDVSPLDQAASARPAVGAPSLGAVKQELWDPALCEVVPEPDKGVSFSDSTFGGACPFTHHGAATCRARGDDYYAIITRKLRDGNEVQLYINVERYTGPGTYDQKTEVLVLIQRGQSLYRWSNLQASVTLGFGEGGMSTNDKNAEQGTAAGTPTRVQLVTMNLTPEPGTPTRGALTIGGSIACILPKPLGR